MDIDKPSGPPVKDVQQPPMTPRFPQRYVIRDTEGGGRVLNCIEAPNIQVQVQSGLTISAAAAKKYPPYTIFLDGVVQSGPFLDLEKQIYNFDHHEGCVRQFTLSTCEQVLVMILKGMDLRGRDWKVLANEPDLDVILSIWLILNHVRIQQRGLGTWELLPALVRVEGVIDAHGLEMMDLCGISKSRIQNIRKAIDFLRAEEIDLKRHAIWEESDFLEYTSLILHKLDRLVYKTDDFTDFKDLKELARVEIGNNRIAVVVDAELGIYELEPYLNRLYGESLGIAILRKDEDTYTLRRLDPFMPGDLNAVYRRLNDIDPAIRSRTNGNRWGGSSDIGGSPRGIGTKLTPEEIAKACRDAYRKSGIIGNLKRFITAAAAAGAAVAGATIAQYYLKAQPWLEGSMATRLFGGTDLFFFIVLVVLSLGGLFFFSRGKIWLFGMIAPVGNAWWLILPAAVLAGAAGGVCVPPDSADTLPGLEKALFYLLAIPLACEMLFRGLVHGILAQDCPTQNCSSRWFFSFPSVGAGILYALFIAVITLRPFGVGEPFLLLSTVQRLFAAFAFGVASGFARERSQSLLPPVLFHAAAMIVFFF
ncbi:MAG: CPBP family intramembrane metalloprotease [Desulfobacterales bacterium]